MHVPQESSQKTVLKFGPTCELTLLLGAGMRFRFWDRHEYSSNASVQQRQVRCFWKMLAYRAHGKKVLWLNLGETSVQFSTAPPVGCIVHKRHWPPSVPPHAKVRPAARRGCFTYCAVVCSNTAVQPHLPHFLVGTEATISKKLLKAYNALPKTKLQVLRRKTAWVTSAEMVLILRELARALKPHCGAEKCVPILCLDCAPCHLTREVMQAARRCKIELVYIPAASTRLLQPLDVYAFTAFKHCLRCSYQDLRRTAPDGTPEALPWLWALGEMPRHFFAARKWAKAFAGVGATGEAAQLHSTLAAFMQHPETLPVSAKPTAEEVQCLWPRKRSMPYAYACLFKPPAKSAAGLCMSQACEHIGYVLYMIIL